MLPAVINFQDFSWENRHCKKSVILLQQNGVRIEDYWIINGTNYSKTLEAWLQRLDENIDKVKAILQRAYGDDADKQLFNWRLFFIFCSEVFGYEGGNEWIVSQHLFKKQQLSNL